MIAVLIAKLVSAGVPPRLVKPVLIVAAVIGAALLTWIVINALVASHDEAVIEQHDAKINTQVFERNANLNDIAADARVKDAVRQTQERASLEKVTNDETIPADDRRRAYYRELRRQAEAGGNASADR